MCLGDQLVGCANQISTALHITFANFQLNIDLNHHQQPCQKYQTQLLKKLIPNPPSVSLATLTFDWNSTEQHDDFQLFCKSVDSWFTLQNVAPEIPPGDPITDTKSTCLEYVLNFLGNTGHKKFDRWKPTGSDAEVAKKKKSAQEFLDYLSSTMDHAVSQCYKIYQLEDVCIWPGESPDELVDHLQALTDWCNFPTKEEKEQNVQYRFIRALNDKELVKKLLALDLIATTSKMLEVCHTHIAISDISQGHGIESTEVSKCHMEAEQTSPWEETSSRQCTLMWSLHEVPPTWLIILPSMGR